MTLRYEAVPRGRGEHAVEAVDLETAERFHVVTFGGTGVRSAKNAAEDYVSWSNRQHAEGCQ